MVQISKVSTFGWPPLSGFVVGGQKSDSRDSSRVSTGPSPFFNRLLAISFMDSFTRSKFINVTHNAKVKLGVFSIEIEIAQHSLSTTYEYSRNKPDDTYYLRD